MVVELSDCNIKWCHSRGCPEDLPHWRRVPGFPVYGVGQPSEGGFSQVSEKVSKDKCIWFNMRQEPVAYIGGQPVTPRKSVNPHDNLEIPGKVEDMDKLEVRRAILTNKQTRVQQTSIAGQVCGDSGEQEVWRGKCDNLPRQRGR